VNLCPGTPCRGIFDAILFALAADLVTQRFGEFLRGIGNGHARCGAGILQHQQAGLLHCERFGVASLEADRLVKNRLR